MPRLIKNSARNPLIELVSFVAAAMVAVAAFLFGAVLLAIILGLIAVGALAFSVRLWWLRRKLAGAPRKRAAQGAIIEAEYIVVQKDKDRDNR